MDRMSNDLFGHYLVLRAEIDPLLARLCGGVSLCAQAKLLSVLRDSLSRH